MKRRKKRISGISTVSLPHSQKVEIGMPRGVTPTRVRRRQSDAKWRASVAMCYNIMKNVIPNQKKLGRRKVSKALTLKETERHIVSLERKLKELIEERAPMCGKAILIEKEDTCLTPVSFDDIRQDFATKQHALFMCTTTGGKKRYNVPSDIEASLDQLSQQSCELMVMDHKEVEMTYPHLVGKLDNQRLKSQTTHQSEGELQSLVNTPAENVTFGMCSMNKTPAKKQHAHEPKVIVCTSEKTGKNGKLSCSLRKSSLKTCKQLPFVNKVSTPQSSLQPVSLLSCRDGSQPSTKTSHISTQTWAETSPRVLSSSSSSNLTLSESPLLFSKKSPEKSLPTSLQTFGLSTKSSAGSCTKTTRQPANGFTPVKLPYGLDNSDPMMTFMGTPAKSTIGSPLGCLSIPETPGSCFNGAQYFELSDEEDVTSLLCTESIDSMDLDINFTDRSSNVFDTIESKDSSLTTHCHDFDVSFRDYESDKDQMVPSADNSCLEFDGYLLFHQHSAALMDPDCSQSEKVLNTAHMWEKLEAEDRTLYAKMASHDQDSNDLSADLLNIDLKPLHKESLGIAKTPKDSQEVPSLVLDLSQEIHNDFQPNFIEGYEDLGVFFHSDVMKEDLSGEARDGLDDCEKQSQVVPQIG